MRESDSVAERIVPDDFVDRFDKADTIAEALRLAEQQPSSTPTEELDRCPECDSIRLVRKSNRVDREQRVDSVFICQYCNSHVDKAAPPHAGRRARFEWVREPRDPDERDNKLDPPLADANRETAVAVAIALREPWSDDVGRSYPEIARYLRYKDSWVGQRVREWRDGDHRDLIGEPTPTKEPPVDPAVALAPIGGDYRHLVAGRTPSTDASGGEEGIAAGGGGRRRRWGAYGT